MNHQKLTFNNVNQCNCAMLVFSPQFYQPQHFFLLPRNIVMIPPLVGDTPLSLISFCRWRALDTPPLVDDAFRRFLTPPCRWRVCPVNDKGGVPNFFVLLLFYLYFSFVTLAVNVLCVVVLIQRPRILTQPDRIQAKCSSLIKKKKKVACLLNSQ